MNPLRIAILLHYYITGSEDFPQIHAPEPARVAEEFYQLGLLRKNPDARDGAPLYEGNHDALKTYVEALCRVPLPIKVTQWVLP